MYGTTSRISQISENEFPHLFLEMRFSAGVFCWREVWYNSCRFVEVGLGPKPQNFGAAGEIRHAETISVTASWRLSENLRNLKGCRVSKCAPVWARSLFLVLIPSRLSQVPQKDMD